LQAEEEALRAEEAAAALRAEEEALRAEEAAERAAAEREAEQAARKEARASALAAYRDKKRRESEVAVKDGYPPQADPGQTASDLQRRGDENATETADPPSKGSPSLQLPSPDGSTLNDSLPTPSPRFKDSPLSNHNPSVSSGGTLPSPAPASLPSVLRLQHPSQLAVRRQPGLPQPEPEAMMPSGEEGLDNQANVIEPAAHQRTPLLLVQESMGTASSGLTELCAAAASGLEDSVYELLEGGADPNDAGHDLRVPPLCRAAAAGSLGTVALLLDKKAHPSATNGFGSTALHFAAAKGHETIIQHLVLHGAKLELKNKFGDTALSIAALQNQSAACGLLIDLRADVGCKRNKGWTPLHLAASCGHTAVCDVLCARGHANLEARGQDDVRPLMLAVASGHHFTSTRLLENSANILSTSRHGRTALHFAAASGNHGCCELLLERGGLKLVALNDVQGASAVEYARRSGHARLADAIAGGVIGSPARTTASGERMQVAISPRNFWPRWP
jgi:ankyrin repeat protein